MAVPLVLSGGLLLVPLLSMGDSGPAEQAQVVSTGQSPEGESPGDLAAGHPPDDAVNGADRSGMDAADAAAADPDQVPPSLPVYTGHTDGATSPPANDAGADKPGANEPAADETTPPRSGGRANRQPPPAAPAGRSSASPKRAAATPVSLTIGKPAPKVVAQGAKHGPMPAKPVQRSAPEPEPANVQTGDASWYETKDGTCAHQTLAFGTVVHVTNTDSGRSTQCRVADRGPFVPGRIIDVDRGVFDDIAPAGVGIIPVRISW